VTTIRKKVALLGATGSIGKSTLSVLEENPERYELFAVSAHSNLAELETIVQKYRPALAIIANELNQSQQADVKDMLARLNTQQIATEFLLGTDKLVEVARANDVDIVVAAIVGAAGLASTIAAAEAGKHILLANKEAIVMSGSVLLNHVKQSGAKIVPVDSEHNAIFQCLPEQLTQQLSRGDLPSSSNTRVDLHAQGISKILLTGSGGPFRATPIEQLSAVTPEQACAHPNWSMGKKISVDSATMMNKGLELIEACWLFNCTQTDIEIVIHPQSIIHSMVQYCDGSVLAQMGQPDMRTPIAHALAWPERIASPVKALDWQTISALTFESPDEQRFPALRIAREVAQCGGVSPIVMNAANEVLVAAFLAKQIRFDQIASGVEACLQRIESETEALSMRQIMEKDHETRRVASGLIADWRH